MARWLLSMLMLALLICLLAPHRACGTVFSFGFSADTAATCRNLAADPVKCLGDGESWAEDLTNALTMQGSVVSVFLDTDNFCSTYLVCQGWNVPTFDTSWSAVSVTSVEITIQYAFLQSVHLRSALMTVDQQLSPAALNEQVDAGSGSVVKLPWLYGLKSLPVADTNHVDFGISLQVERINDPGSFSIDGASLRFAATGNATIAGVMPNANLSPGMPITVTGHFFDTTDLNMTPGCNFSSLADSDTAAISLAASVTATEVVCHVPDLGVAPGVFDVKVVLDPAQDDVSPGCVAYYRQRAPVEEDEKPNDNPKAKIDVPLPVLAASGAGVAVLGIAGAVVMMRRNSRAGSGDGDTIGKSAMSLSLSTAVGASASATGTTTATTATTASGVSATSAGGNSTHDTAAVAGAAGAGRRPSKQRRPSHKGRVQRGTSTPLRPAAGKKGAAFETTPVSAFGPARSSMRTAYSVTSEQAPYSES